MNVSISQLEKVIDTIARRCPRGISALLGEAPMPSHDELVTAATWRPATELCGGIPKGGGGDKVAKLCEKVIELTTPLESVGWAKLVKATQEIKELYPLPWAVYRMHVIHVGEDSWRDGGGGIRRIADKCGVSVATVTRWRHLVPRRIAKTALN